MTDLNHQHDAFEDDFEEEEIEAYCVRCREKTIMLKPTPVWTKRGTPGTRGECEMCGSTIFRMGRTAAHRHIAKPNMDRIKKAGGGAAQASVIPRCSAFINYAKDDIYLATRLSEDLGKTGIPTWFDTNTNPDEVNWATGVHPALDECGYMVVVLSQAALADEDVQANWGLFKERGKAVVVAQAGQVEIPDNLRRSPRFNFEEDYKTALRELVQALASLIS